MAAALANWPHLQRQAGKRERERDYHPTREEKFEGNQMRGKHTYLWLLLLGGEVLLLLQQLQLLGRSLRLIAEHSLEQKKYTLSFNSSTNTPIKQAK